jgi:hypothetical protein
MMNTRTKALVPTIFTALALVSCAKGESLGPTYDTDADVDDTDGVILEGFSWCMRANGAVIEIPNLPDPPVEDPNDGDLAPKGCFCASPDEHAGLDTLDMNNDWEVLVPDGTSDDLDQLRSAIRFNAFQNCDDVADTQAGGQWPNNCDDALDVNEPIFLEVEPPGDPDCMAPERIGDSAGMQDPPTDEYTDYYTLSQVIVFNGGENRTYIDDDFYDDMLANPGWLLNDAARIVYDPSPGSPPYRFNIPGTQGVAYKLGFRNNDRPVSINGYTLSGGMIDALAAYTALQHVSTFNFVVKRSGTNITLQYTVQ